MSEPGQEWSWRELTGVDPEPPDGLHAERLRARCRAELRGACARREPRLQARTRFAMACHVAVGLASLAYLREVLMCALAVYGYR